MITYYELISKGYKQNRKYFTDKKAVTTK